MNIPTPLLEALEGPSSEHAFVVREFSLSSQNVSLLRASIFTLQPGNETAADSHAVHEIWFVISGTGQLKYDGRTYPLESRSAYYFAPFKQHAALNNGNGELACYSVWWIDP